MPQSSFFRGVRECGQLILWHLEMIAAIHYDSSLFLFEVKILLHTALQAKNSTFIGTPSSKPPSLVAIKGLFLKQPPTPFSK